MLSSGVILLLFAALTSRVCAQQRIRAKDAFDLTQPIIFRDDFQHGLGKWNLALDAVEDRPGHTQAFRSERIKIVNAPQARQRDKAVRFFLPRKLGFFRSELALPHEEGFNVRLYSCKVLVPASWKFDENPGGDIVMQWHAVMGKELVDRNFPPLDIAIKGNKWVIHRAFGPPARIRRDKKELPNIVEKGRWTSWQVRVKWSSAADGRVQVWLDGKQVWDVSGPNTYSIRPRTPYFKVGIYHPGWKRKNKDSFERETSIVRQKELYVMDVQIGSQDATRSDLGRAAGSAN